MAKPTTINFPGDHKQALKGEANRRNTTMERLILECFKDYIANHPEVSWEAKVKPQVPRPVLNPEQNTPDCGDFQHSSDTLSHLNEREREVLASITVDELPWIQGVLEILRIKRRKAVDAITSNIVMMVDYSHGEGGDEPTGIDLVAVLQARLAALDKLILDEQKKAGVAGPGNTQEPRKRPAQGS